MSRTRCSIKLSSSKLITTSYLGDSFPMSCPQEKKITRKDDGTDVYEYTNAIGERKSFEVPPGHIYRCLNGEWVVIKVPNPPPGLQTS